MCMEVARILKPGGIFIQMSFQQPHFRSRYINQPKYGWDYNVYNIDRGLGYFFYVMKKST